MSEQNALESQPAVVDEVPQEVRDLQQALGDFAQYRNALTLGMFPGSQAEQVDKLRKHLKEVYEQLFKQFNEHPYVIKIKEQEKK